MDSSDDEEAGEAEVHEVSAEDKKNHEDLIRRNENAHTQKSSVSTMEAPMMKSVLAQHGKKDNAKGTYEDPNLRPAGKTLS